MRFSPGFEHSLPVQINLLLTEDDPDFVRLAKAWLSRSRIQFNVMGANSLSEALRLCETNSFDVILADLNLIDSAGTDTVFQLRARNPLVPIVVLSASDGEELMYQTVLRGAHDFLVKPACGTDLLVSTILSSIARQFESVTAFALEEHFA